MAKRGTKSSGGRARKRLRFNPRAALKWSKKAMTQVHSFTRYATTPTNISITGTTASYADVFKLDLLPGVSDFTALFDRYRITKVLVYFQLVTNPDSNSYLNQTATSNQANWYPKLWYTPDYDDSSTLTKTDIQQYAKAKCAVLKPNEVVTVAVYPAVTVQTYRSAATTGYSPNWKLWIDMGQSDVPHYGLKYVIDTNQIDIDDTYPFKVNVEYKYFIDCKDVR